MTYNAGVRVSHSHRSLSTMALAAILLIVLAPLASRWIAHGAGAAKGDGVHAVVHSSLAPQQHQGSEHHHHGGSETSPRVMSGDHDHHAMAAHSDAPARLGQTDRTRKDPHAGHDMGLDCEYCLIAARMVSLLVALVLALIGWRPPHFARAWTLNWGSSIAAGHLGARGPPLRA